MPYISVIPTTHREFQDTGPNVFGPKLAFREIGGVWVLAKLFQTKVVGVACCEVPKLECSPRQVDCHLLARTLFPNTLCLLFRTSRGLEAIEPVTRALPEVAPVWGPHHSHGPAEARVEAGMVERVRVVSREERAVI